jgi:hypothetical protein
MDAELTALATAGATALVQQMATDGWAQVRDRVAAFFSRRGGDDSVGGALDLAREELQAAQAAGDDEAAADVQAEWRNRLRRALRADPALAGELRSLLAELTPESEPRSVTNTIIGGVHHGPVIQAGSIDSVTFGSPRRGGRQGGPA